MVAFVGGVEKVAIGETHTVFTSNNQLLAALICV